MNARTTEKDPGKQVTACYHCGEPCDRHSPSEGPYIFCCEGCKLVYEMLSENNLCNYYNIGRAPGHARSADQQLNSTYSVLDTPGIREKFIQFEDKTQARVTFHIPGMHCSSCIWLLEHLPRLNPAIVSSRVNFPAREVSIDFAPDALHLSEIAILLNNIGYTPTISMNGSGVDRKPKRFNSRVLKIGIAGFCFGNIMLLSFPEYLGAGELAELPKLKLFFAWLSLALALPVILYCASEFFVSAVKAIRQRTLNIDAPIALALSITFLRSLYEITIGGGTSYLDSMSGIVFFMLIGRYFQDRTYQSISFERDYKSYFPIAVTVVRENSMENIPVTQLKPGDTMLIRNEELIPADSVLCSSKTYVDYSFVTGEAQPVRRVTGELIYAGARQSGGAAEYKVVKATSQSYLTQLWNNDAFSSKRKVESMTYVDRINTWFTLSLFIVAGVAALAWLFIDSSKSLNVLTAVLIVACPCTLLLGSTFTNGTVLRWLGRKGFYLKNADVIERLANADTIVFDKTGTITDADSSAVKLEGGKLSADELTAVISLAGQSGHPLSRRIVSSFPARKTDVLITEVKELNGRGISGVVNGIKVAIGSAAFAGESSSGSTSTEVWIAIHNKVRGKFSFTNKFRDGFSDVSERLSKKYSLQLLSGDNDSSRKDIETLLGRNLFYSKSPQEKLDHIRQLQAEKHRVIMVGDGLNDAGALMQSDAGIVVSDNLNNYFPACDAILDGRMFHALPQLLRFTRVARKVLIAAFIVSVVYNIAGLSIAVAGLLDPLVAAVLMPASSLTVVLISTVSVTLAAKRILSGKAQRV